MRILENGQVEITNKRTGETKVIQPQDLPNYGISYSKYQTELNAFKESVQGEVPVTAESQKETSKLETVKANVRVLEKNLNESELRGPAASKMLWLSSVTGGAIFPQSRDYEALRKSLIGPMARIISGEVGVLTDRDIKRAEELLPNLTDTKTVSTNKLNNIRELIAEREGKKKIDEVPQQQISQEQIPQEGQGKLGKAFDVISNILIPRTKKLATEQYPEFLQKGQGMSYTQRLKEGAKIGIPAGAEAATWALPATGATIKSAAKIGAGIGGLLGATSPEELSIGQRVGRTAAGAGLGGVLGGALGIGRAGFKWLTNLPQAAKEKAANQILGLSPSKVKITKEGSNWLSSKVVEKFDDGTLKPGNYQEMGSQAQTLLTQAENEIQNIVNKKTTTGTIKLSKMISPADDLINQANKAGKPAKAKAIQKFIDTIKEQWPEDLSINQALSLKRILDGDLSQSMFAKTASEISGAVASGQRALGDTTRKAIREKIPEIGKLLDDESVYINLSAAMQTQLQRMGLAPLGRSGAGGLLYPLNVLSKTLTYPLRHPTSMGAGINLLEKVPKPKIPSKTGDILEKILMLQTAGRL